MNAGSPRGLDAPRLFALQAFAGLIAGTVFGLGRLLAGQSLRAALLAGAAGGLAAFFLPHVWISMKATKRQDGIRREMPDMLDMLLNLGRGWSWL